VGQRVLGGLPRRATFLVKGCDARIYGKVLSARVAHPSGKSERWVGTHSLAVDEDHGVVDACAWGTCLEERASTGRRFQGGVSECH